MSANIDSTANTDGIKNGGDIGAMTTVVNTNAAESQDPMVNGIWMAIIKPLPKAPKVTLAVPMIVIHQDIISARLHSGRRDQDLHQATRHHLATPVRASLATETEPMRTSHECRWMSHGVVDTGPNGMVPVPTLNQGDGLYEPPEVGTADRFG
ncbi:MAG: hypothetical protein ALECFALPRED_008686 [Alectoria fallacina]|uniref:Uncharacterized protein n=1 Tax=Alectoria fallacina TaxID=1903189 RepID=A0A8H3J4E0_9LECA|nr:MAG: hypothetical protein ALECFALPRED_008686 [Alectoria fallacina]